MSGATAFQVGQIRIDRILETEVPFMAPEDAFLDPTEEGIAAHRRWLEPRALCPTSGKLILAVQSYLVRSERHTILIDTCIGCDKSNPWFTPWHKRSDRAWLGALAGAGVGPEQVDYVFCTHLHSDHCGWNTVLRDGRWRPTFPRAKYILAKREVEHYAAQPGDAYRESVLPVIEAGQALLVEGDYALDDEIRLEPTPGHTPGHVAVRLASEGREAVMCGDVMHSPIQCAFPDWRFCSDVDPEQARRTRRAFLEAHCETNRLIMTAHFPTPSVGHVIPTGRAFGFRYL